MRQIGTKSARYFKKIVTFVLAFAMIVTSLAVSSTESEAAKKKVKKVKIGVKVGGSGILVLKKGQKKKLNVSVTPKKASKKVSYKSSNKKVVSVNKKGVVKALKKKGSAKITVTSKQNKKKKATITVKIGTPAKKVAIQKTAEMKWQSANFTLVEENGQKKKVYEKFNEKVTLKNGAFEAQAGRTLTLKADLSPQNATSKKIKWTANKGGTYVALIQSGKTCIVSLKKVEKKPTYDVKVTATAMDGSGKKSSVLIKVGEFQSDKTPAPTEAPDTRIKTMVENFESYPVGTTWDKYTSAGKNSGTMTVVADPENPDNKCLEIKYDGTDTAYDFAPVFNVDLAPLSDSTGKSAAGKTMSNYTAINADMRVVGDDGDVKYKTIYAYFDQYGAIQKSDKFAANDNKTASGHVDKDGNAVAAGSANEEKSLRFGVEISHATGSDVEVAKKLYNGNETKEKAKYMPAFYDTVWKEDKSTWFTKDSAMTGYKPFADASKYADGVVPNVGFASKSLTIDYSRVKELDATLPDQTKFDVVIGSTYAGTPTYSKINPPTSVTVYMDNISLSEETIPVTDFTVSADGEGRVSVGGTMPLTVAYTPENTTQKGLTWTTNNEQVTVDAAGKVTVAENFVFPEGQEEAKVLVTATSTVNPALTKSIEITIYALEIPNAELYITAEMYDEALSETTIEKTTDAEGRECMKLNFTKNNQRVFFKLPEVTDLSIYESVEIEACVAQQMSFDTWSEGLSKDTENWWETDSAGTYPFYMGSHAIRPASDITLEDFAAAYPEIDGSSYAVDGVIPGGTPIGEIGTEIVTYKLNDIKQGDWSKTAYVALGSNQVPDDDWEVCNYYIYSIKFIPKAPGTDAETGSVESPSTESATTEAATN